MKISHQEKCVIFKFNSMIVKKCLKIWIFRSKVIKSFPISQVFNFWLPFNSIFKPIFPTLIVFYGLINLFLCVHHKRSMTSNWFFQRLASNDQKFSSIFTLDRMINSFGLRSFQYTAIQRLDNMSVFFSWVDKIPFIDKNYWIPSSINR